MSQPWWSAPTNKLNGASGNAMHDVTKYWVKRTLALIAFGVDLKVLLGIKVVDFGLVISGWMFFGSLITIDDDLPGGFYNPDGDEPFPKFELLGLGVAFAVLGLLKVWSQYT